MVCPVIGPLFVSCVIAAWPRSTCWIIPVLHPVRHWHIECALIEGGFPGGGGGGGGGMVFHPCEEYACFTGNVVQQCGRLCVAVSDCET